MAWVYNLPSWFIGILFVGGLSAISAGGLFLAWRFVPTPARNHNDVAGPMISTIGVVLAVMLSFMVVTVWQEYDAAASVVNTEAGEIADLYHETAALPLAQRAAIREGLQLYVKLVVNEEWPLMRQGLVSNRARLTITNVARFVELYQPTTMAEQNAQADAIAHSHNILDARRSRLFANVQSVPPLLWSVMIFMALVTIASMYLFDVPSRGAHLLMAIALAAVIGASFMIIAELDLPFRGDLQIPPTAYSQDEVVFASGF